MSTIAEDSKEQELAEAVKHFERDVYGLFENVLDLDLMVEAKQHIEWLMQKNPTLRPENLGHTLVADDPFWVRSISGAGIDPSLFDATAAVDCALKSGGVEVHHPNIIHGSELNNSPLRRGGLTIHYTPTSTCITQSPWPCAILLRGDAVAGVNEYVSKPKYVEGRDMPFRGCELP